MMDQHLHTFLLVIHDLFAVAFECVNTKPHECTGEITGDASMDMAEVRIGDHLVDLNRMILDDTGMAYCRPVVMSDAELDEGIASIYRIA